MRTSPGGDYETIDFGRHRSDHLDGGAGGCHCYYYYYRLKGRSCAPGWCWQHGLLFFQTADGQRPGDFDLSGPIKTNLESRLAIGSKVDIPQPFLAWPLLCASQDPVRSFHRTCNGGRYRIEDRGIFASEGQMCLDGMDIPLDHIEDIEDVRENAVLPVDGPQQR